MTDFGSSIKQAEEFDFAILGIPFDEKSCYMKGAAKGPQAIRAASTRHVLTECAACKMQIEHIASTTVTHPIKIIAQAYGL